MKNEPDIKKNEPDIKKNEPDIKKNEPDIKKNEPDIRKNEPEVPDIPKLPGLEERVARLEAAIAQLTHFITPQERPNVDKAPLRKERSTRKKQ